MKKRIALLLAAAMISTMTFAGCTGTPKIDFAKTYVQGVLDTLYLGQYNEDFLAITDYENSDPLATEYESGIRTETDYFAYYFNVSVLTDSARADLIDLYKEIYSYSKYAIAPSVEAEGVYTVDVVVSPIDVIQNVVEQDITQYMETFQTSLDDGVFADLTEAEYEDLYVSGIIALIRDQMADIGYMEAKTVTVSVVKDEEDGLYYIQDDGLAQIDEYIIKY